MKNIIRSALIVISLALIIRPVMFASADLIITEPRPYQTQESQTEEEQAGEAPEEKREISFFGLPRGATAAIVVVALAATVVRVYARKRY